MTEAAAAAPEPVLPGGWTLVALERVGSTNDEAARLAADGAADRTMVWTRRQDAGKARRGRGWVSSAGNLFCSAILRPDCPIATAGQVGFLVSLALRDALAGLAPGLEARLKWPNDVLVEGRKISGILLETAGTADGRAQWIVAGLGVNVATHPEGVETPATSLGAAGAGDVSVEAVLERYTTAFSTWLDRWRRDGFPAVRTAWLAGAQGVGGRVRVRLERETLTGIFTDLDRDGALLLRLDDGGTRRVTAGDVFFPDVEPAQGG